MKIINDILIELSQRIATFGSSEESIAIINDAIEANSWFTASDISLAMTAIRTEMLDPAKINKWLANYPTLPCSNPRHVAIIMAGNIPLVGLFDLLCTLAAGHQAWIKPSSKDRVLMEYICNQIKDIEPSTPICMYDETREYDAVIATGGNDANRYFESKFATTKRLCRTSRHSIAVLSENPTPHELDLLAEDIYSYSGLGCRNVSMIFAPRGAKVSFPSVATTLNYRDNYLRTKALLTIKGQEFEDNGTSILVRSHQEPSSLSMITIWEYDSLSEVEEWIAENDHFIQCIVCNNNIKHPRQVSFGEAQHPTLFDYADGVDTMIFLKLDN